MMSYEERTFAFLFRTKIEGGMDSLTCYASLGISLLPTYSRLDCAATYYSMVRIRNAPRAEIGPRRDMVLIDRG